MWLLGFIMLLTYNSKLLFNVWRLVYALKCIQNHDHKQFQSLIIFRIWTDSNTDFVWFGAIRYPNKVVTSVGYFYKFTLNFHIYNAYFPKKKSVLHAKKHYLELNSHNYLNLILNPNLIYVLANNMCFFYISKKIRFLAASPK